MHWSRWGDPALAAPISAELRELVEAFLGPLRDRPAVDPDAVRLPAPTLSAELAGGLERLVSPTYVRTDRDARLAHTRGRSTPDLLRIRAGDAADAPDAVVAPADHDETAAVVSWCADHAVAVVPFGGGTSVVGGLAPERAGLAGVVALDLARLRRLLRVDPVSRTATLEAGLRGPDAEALLAEHGLTLGHFPQSFEYATLGGFAATRSSGQASAGYGRFDQMVTSLRVATPVGDWSVGTAPASAAGPDLRQLVLGSEGAFGVVTELGLRVRPRPEASAYDGWRLASFDDGLSVVRALAQEGPLPTVLRLSDETETAVNLADPAEVGASSAGGCLLVAGYAGTRGDVAQRRAAAGEVLNAHGATALGEGPGATWERGRFSGPYLRDSLLDVGVLVETLETAGYWSDLPRLYAAAKGAIEADLSAQGTPPLVLCHVSHVYETGASLYLTVAARELDDAAAQWQRAKSAALDAIVGAGGTISHHHGVGRDHVGWLTAEIGPVGVEVLRAVKQRVDPAGILNPGVLVP
jgi:alkyldihydroxyacetonephosphate synthase